MNEKRNRIRMAKENTPKIRPTLSMPLNHTNTQAHPRQHAYNVCSFAFSMNVFYSIPDAHLFRFLVLICLIFGRISSITWSQKCFQLSYTQNSAKKREWNRNVRKKKYGSLASFGWQSARRRMEEVKRQFAQKCEIVPSSSSIHRLLCNFSPRGCRCCHCFLSIAFYFCSSEWTKIHIYTWDW